MFSLTGRIDASNVEQWEEKLFAQQKVQLDAADLEYISSAGLRILLKFKKAGHDVCVYNASDEVYEIFDVTGFTSLFPVKKKRREVSIEGCEQIGCGSSAKVYRLDKERVIKVLNSNIPSYSIDHEAEYSKKALLADINVAISYDVVKVGEQLGLIYELVDSDTMISAISQHPEHFEKYMDLYIKLLRQMRDADISGQGFAKKSQKTLGLIDMLEGILDETEREKARHMYARIPEGNSFIHGDCHMGNIMLQKEEALFIDLGGACIGNHLWNIICVAEVYYVLAKVLPEEALVKAAGVGKEMCEKIWNYVIEHYFDVAMEKSKLIKVLTSYATLNMLAAVKFQIFPKEIVPALKNILFSCQEQEYEILPRLTNT